MTKASKTMKAEMLWTIASSKLVSGLACGLRVEDCGCGVSAYLRDALRTERGKAGYRRANRGEALGDVVIQVKAFTIII